METTETKSLAVVCLYLLLRRAIPDFPGTNRGSPSTWVVVSRTVDALLRDGDQVYFPKRIHWKTWQKVVIPLLTVTNPGTDPSNIGSGAIPDPLTGECFDLGVEIKTTLRASLRLQGNLKLAVLGEYETLIAKIERALVLLMVDQGMLPEGRIQAG